MKHLYLNLKRFDIPKELEGVNSLAPVGNFEAFTTNLTANAAKAIGCSSVLIGHCEERKDKLEILAAGGGGNSSAVNSLLYEGVMKYKPEDPAWEGRDRLVCSKGHAGPAVYSALALKGFFPMDWIHTLNQGGTNLPSHCDMNRTPGIDMTTGSRDGYGPERNRAEGISDHGRRGVQ